MSTHIKADFSQIAETVFLPGDPLRAQYIAENFLFNIVQYNKVRNMLGYTGLTSDGRRVSVQGSGMGMPSLSIYVNELINEYGVKRIIRVGSCGSLQEDIKCRDIIVATGASSTSSMNNIRFNGLSFAPVASWSLLLKAHEVISKKGLAAHFGNILSTDLFYEDSDIWKIFAQYKVFGIEMETAELYTLGAKLGIETLAINTVSDSLITHDTLSSEEREKSFAEMVEIALEL